MVKEAFCRSLTAEARVKSHTSPHEICGGQSDTQTGLYESTSAAQCQDRATNCPQFSLSCQRDNSRVNLAVNVVVK